MWKLFTERARRVVFVAQEEAGRLGDDFVSTEHLLLSLVTGHDSYDTQAVRILERFGVRPDQVRAEVERQIALGDRQQVQGMKLTAVAKRAIDSSHTEMTALRHSYIGTEHLLLGLVAEDAGLAGRALRELGVGLERARYEARRLQEAASSGRVQATVAEASEAIATYALGLDTGDWMLAASKFSGEVAVDYSALGGTVGTVTRGKMREFLAGLFDKPEVRGHTIIEQVLTSPLDVSEFIAYYSARYAKGTPGQATLFDRRGWYRFRLRDGFITALAVSVWGTDGDASVVA